MNPMNNAKIQPPVETAVFTAQQTLFHNNRSKTDPTSTSIQTTTNLQPPKLHSSILKLFSSTDTKESKEHLDAKDEMDKLTAILFTAFCSGLTAKGQVTATGDAAIDEMQKEIGKAGAKCVGQFFGANVKNQHSLLRKLFYIYHNCIGFIFDQSMPEITRKVLMFDENSGRFIAKEIKQSLETFLKRNSIGATPIAWIDEVIFVSYLKRVAEVMDAIFKNIQIPEDIIENVDALIISISTEAATLEHKGTPISNQTDAIGVLTTLFANSARNRETIRAKRTQAERCKDFEELKLYIKRLSLNDLPANKLENIIYHLELAREHLRKSANHFSIRYDATDKTTTAINAVNDNHYTLISSVLKALELTLNQMYEMIKVKNDVLNELTLKFMADMYSALIAQSPPQPQSLSSATSDRSETINIADDKSEKKVSVIGKTNRTPLSAEPLKILSVSPKLAQSLGYSATTEQQATSTSPTLLLPKSTRDTTTPASSSSSISDSSASSVLSSPGLIATAKNSTPATPLTSQQSSSNRYLFTPPTLSTCYESDDDEKGPAPNTETTATSQNPKLS